MPTVSELIAFLAPTPATRLSAEDPPASAPAPLAIATRGPAIDAPALAAAGLAAPVHSEQARLDFIRVVARFFAPPRPRGIAPSAVIAPSARVDESAYVGPLASLGERVEVGA